MQSVFYCFGQFSDIFSTSGVPFMEKTSKYKFIFGPVESRRLGRSLGINLVPFKTCSMDCVYCECGSTTFLTNTPGEFFPPEQILAELDCALAQRKKNLGDYALDYVTFSGLGEPSLASCFGEIIAHIRKNYPDLKICFLTNASLFSDPTVRANAASAHLVIPSLDGSCEEEFCTINRPEKSVTFEKIVKGIMDFRKESRGKCRMYLEIFLVPGVNDSESSAERFRLLVEKIAPDAVQLNFLDRPGLYSSLKPVSCETLERFIQYLGKSAPIEIPARKERSPEGSFTEIEFRMLGIFYENDRMLTLAFLAEKLDLPAEETVRHLRILREAGFAEEIFEKEGTGGRYALTEKAVKFITGKKVRKTR